LPENLYLKAFSGEKFGKGYHIEISSLFFSKSVDFLSNLRTLLRFLEFAL